MRLQRTQVLFVCLSMAIGSAANAQIVGYWNFDDNTADQTGNGNDGTIMGGVTYDVDVPAVLGAGKSANFDGVPGTLVNVNQNANLPITTQSAFSISMWVKGDGTNDNNDDRVFSELYDDRQQSSIQSGDQERRRGCYLRLFLSQRQQHGASVFGWRSI